VLSNIGTLLAGVLLVIVMWKKSGKSREVVGS
jgi:hypothetical protein